MKEVGSRRNNRVKDTEFYSKNDRTPLKALKSRGVPWSDLLFKAVSRSLQFCMENGSEGDKSRNEGSLAGARGADEGDGEGVKWIDSGYTEEVWTANFTVRLPRARHNLKRFPEYKLISLSQ